jgi:hypothetical protein
LLRVSAFSYTGHSPGGYLSPFDYRGGDGGQALYLSLIFQELRDIPNFKTGPRFYILACGLSLFAGRLPAGKQENQDQYR